MSAKVPWTEVDLSEDPAGALLERLGYLRLAPDDPQAARESPTQALLRCACAPRCAA